MSDDHKSNDIVQTGATLAELNAMLLALSSFIPGVGPAPALLAASVEFPARLTAFLNMYSTRKQAERATRARRLADILCKKLANESVQCDDQQLDLYIEVIKRAISDDEDRKTPIYAAIIEWIIREKPSSLHVRLLSDGASQLAYVELYCILYELNTKRAAQEVLEVEGMQSVLWTKRIAAHGLGEDGPRYIGHGPVLAKVLAKYVDWGSLISPNKVAERNHVR